MLDGTLLATPDDRGYRKDRTVRIIIVGNGDWACMYAQLRDMDGYAGLIGIGNPGIGMCGMSGEPAYLFPSHHQICGAYYTAVPCPVLLK